MDTGDKPTFDTGSDVAPDSVIDSTSDEAYLNDCSPCEHRGIQKQACAYCLSCKERMCSACKDYHKSFKQFRDHQFASVVSDRKVLTDAKLASWSTVNIRLSTDKRSPQMTGCAILSPKRVLICDRGNMRIKLLDSGNSYKIIESLDFPSEARDLCVVDSNTIIVTLYDHKILQYVDVQPKMKARSALLLSKAPLAVEYIDGEIYVACKVPRIKTGTGEILVLDKEGTVRRHLGVNVDGSCMFDAPTNIAYSSSTKNIFVSDRDTSVVTCLSPTGNVLFQIKSPDLARPRGIYIDAVDNILVCGETSNNVVVFTPKGEKYRTLLSKTEIPKQPCAIAYDGSNDTLLIGCYNNDHMLVVKLET